MIIINLKNYKSGDNVLRFLKEVEKIDSNIVVCVPFLNLEECIEKSKLTVYSQHVDYIEQNKSTGYVLIDSLKKKNVLGSLINHFDHKIDFYSIENLIKKNKNFKFIVCVSSLSEAKRVSKLSPYAIAYENPKLIAGRRSIVASDYDKLKKFVDILKRTNVIPIYGAGIRSKYDYKRVLELGCKGILISSIIVNNKNYTKVLKEFTEVVK